MRGRKSWKKHSKNRHIGHTLVNLVRLTLSFTLLTVLIIGSIYYYKNSKQSVWDQKDPITLVINTNPVIVANLNPTNGTLTLLPIPNDTYVEVPKGYGSYRMGTVFALGELEGKGGELLSETVQDFLGIPMDGWISVKDSPNTPLTEKDLREKAQSITSLETILKIPQYKTWLDQNTKSNLSLIDKGFILWNLHKIRFDKIKISNLEDNGVLSELILADGSKAKTADLLRLDATAQDLFSDKNLAKERLKIEVLNGTNTPGIGNKVGRLITNMGGTLISVGNTDNSNIQKTQIIAIGQNAKDSYTAKKLAKTLKCDIKEEQNQASRAEITVIIGFDLVKRATERGTY